MNTKHLVIDAKIHRTAGKPHDGSTLEFLCNSAVVNGYTHFWVHPSAEMDILEDATMALLSEEWDNPIFNYQFKEGAPNNHLVSVYARKKLPNNKKSHAVLVTFLAYSPWHWQDLSPEKTLELVKIIEQALGLPMGSPSTMGMKYVQQIVTKYHPKWIARPTSDLSAFNFTTPLVWHRAPTEEELQCKYIYGFDKNSTYPRMGVAEKFGVGEPEHYSDVAVFDPKLPGMWRVTVQNFAQLDERLPSPLHKLEGREWLPTAIVKLLISRGYTVELKEALVFPKSEFVFKQSIENLWDLRCEFEKGTPERDAFKNIMNSLVGATRAAYDAWKNRPDWYTQFVSCARAVVYYNMLKIAEKDNMYPILCLTDSLVYLSNAETPEQAVPSMLLNPNSLGGYKCEFRIEVTDEVRSILTSKLSPGMKIHELKAIGGK